jgi:hypothetical protein
MYESSYIKAAMCFKGFTSQNYPLKNGYQRCLQREKGFIPLGISQADNRSIFLTPIICLIE